MKLKPITIFILFAFSALCSCHVMLIGAYDAVTDQGIQKIQFDVTEILVRIRKNIVDQDTAENNYARFKSDYIQVESESQSLKIRCDILPKYQIVAQQVGLLNENINTLEKLHKSGIRDTLTLNVLIKTFNINFTSMITLQDGLKQQTNK